MVQGKPILLLVAIAVSAVVAAPVPAVYGRDQTLDLETRFGGEYAAVYARGYERAIQHARRDTNRPKTQTPSQTTITTTFPEAETLAQLRALSNHGNTPWSDEALKLFKTKPELVLAMDNAKLHPADGKVRIRSEIIAHWHVLQGKPMITIERLSEGKISSSQTFPSAKSLEDLIKQTGGPKASPFRDEKLTLFNAPSELKMALVKLKLSLKLQETIQMHWRSLRYPHRKST